MHDSSFDRRALLRLAGAASVAAAAGAVALRVASAGAARPDAGVSAFPFGLGEVQLTTSRWLDNQNRTLAYLRFINADRMLHTFRLNAGLSSSAQPCGGWEAPNVELRGHTIGHLLSALAQAYVNTGDTTYKTKGDYIITTLATCQAASPSRGFHTGYLSAFPENFFDRLESGQSVWAPWYTIHKIMAGLLDQYVIAGNAQAGTVVTNMAGWVEWRTGRLSTAQMQSVLSNEFGGMTAVLADLYQATGDTRWLTTAQRFDHASVLNPLAANSDQLNGLHANTQVPKWIGAAREYKATGTTRYRDIAANAWNITVGAHSYIIGGNSVGEHFKMPNAIAAYLTGDTCENCNTYNMLKLTRELFTLYPDRADLFDFYERALINQMIGQQNPNDSHGHVCYFTPLNPGGRRSYCSDYDSFWCCQGTGLETQTRLADSIYFYADTTLIVNLFLPSVLTWTQRGITVTQTTSYPASDTTTLTVSGTVSGTWTMRIRIPGWALGATISVNGVPQTIATTPGSYAALTRTWTSGDAVTVRLPMQPILRATNDNANVSALIYGPVVLAGNYGNATLSASPSLTATSITRTSSTALTFTATANGSTVNLIPFYDAHAVNYVVYWNARGTTPTAPPSTPSSSSSTPGPSASSSGATGGMGATYQAVSTWSGGFQGQVTVTNAGSSTVTGWVVTMTMSAGQTVTSLWNGVNTGTSGTVTVTNASYNGTIAPGASATFGFTASGDGTTNPTIVKITSR